MKCQLHKADHYLDALAQEIHYRAPLFRQRRVTQLNWGGGTSTFLNHDQLSRLVALLREHFSLADDLEMSIEVDPREIASDTITHLRQLGFNRLSMGVQDFSKAAQERVNRVQDEEAIFTLMARAREQGFHSTSIDLIYGLPL
ncbi:Oxygen-independent coproporphyrinogen-III oxidase|nr:Oxygen-independent coproporphyrinogen-III oxidase [Candidatus Pantoea persica]